VAFDLLHLDGHDIRQMPLEDRRHLLSDLVGLEPGTISFSQGIVSSGADFYRAVDKLGLEGMVSKRADSRYCSGRSTAWLKIKCYEEAMLQVMGVVRKPGQATQAILADHEHRYVGKAAVTLNNQMRERLWERVKAKAGPMPAGLPKDVQRNKADWLQPGLVGRVRFLKVEETLRHATLRDVEELD
jgi:ATP-dependent DNA ligase